MLLEKCHIKTKCNHNDCNNAAEYTIKYKLGLKTFQMQLCNECLCTLYKEIGNFIVPKAIENPLKNFKIMRRKNNE